MGGVQTPHGDKREIEKFNPYHDRLGRFTTAGGAVSFTYKPGKGKIYDNAIQRESGRGDSNFVNRASSQPGETNITKPGAKGASKSSSFGSATTKVEAPKKQNNSQAESFGSFDPDYVRSETRRLLDAGVEEQAEFLRDHGFTDKTIDSLKEWGGTDGTEFGMGLVGSLARRSTRDKSRGTQQNQREYIDKDSEKVADVMKEGKMSEEQAGKVIKGVSELCETGRISNENYKDVEKYLKTAPVYEGTTYMPLSYADDQAMQNFLKNCRLGEELPFDWNAPYKNGVSVWSANPQEANSAAIGVDYGVVLECIASRSGVSVSHLNKDARNEQTVMRPYANYRVIDSTEEEINGRTIRKIRVVECKT